MKKRPDLSIQIPNSEHLNNNPELPTDLQNIMGFQNPRLEEYEALANLEQLNDMAWMNANHAYHWYDERRPLPPMPEKNNPILKRKLLDYQSAEVQQSQLLVAINSDDISGIWPLLTYEELVNQYWHGQEHQFELSEILKESDSETVDAFNNIIREFNSRLATIREKKDVEAVKNCHQEIEKLLLRELNCDTNITEAFFHKKLKGKILVDCGGGSGGMMAVFAKKFGVEAYINVDKHTNQKGRILVGKSEGMTKIGCQMDMLLFLAQLQSRSVSITINGIDSYLIVNPKYHAALACEIERVVAEDGIVFGANSTALKNVSENIFGATFSGRSPRLDLVLSKFGHNHCGELRIFTA